MSGTSWWIEPGNIGAVALLIGGVLSWAARFGMRRLGSRFALAVFSYTAVAVPTVIFFARPEIVGPPLTAAAATLSTALIAFLVDERTARTHAAVTGSIVLAVGVRLATAATVYPSNAIVVTLAATSLLALTALVVVLFVRDERQLRGALQHRTRVLEHVVDEAREVASGDLRPRQSRPGNDDDDVLMNMVESLRTMVDEVRAIVARVGSASRRLEASSEARAGGAKAQARAVQDIGATLEALSDAASSVAQGASETARRVDQSVQHHRDIADLMADLAEKTARISEVVGLIRGIARKVEILALNAALEGVHAGAAGAGFALVASEMQGLAEEVLLSLRDVQTVTEGIEEATRRALAAADEGRDVAEQAANTALGIGRVSAEQATRVEQAARSASEIGGVADAFASTSGDTLAASHELRRLAERLEASVDRFRTR
ncbi:MAG: methyl-accepting chemotaxis protein [Myxococcota bacterium]